MNITKVQYVNFGMPKISDNVKKMLPKNLSEKYKELLNHVEKKYPSAQMDIESFEDLPLDHKYDVLDEVLSRSRFRSPIYYILVKGKTNETLPDDGSCYDRGRVYPVEGKLGLGFPQVKNNHSSKIVSEYGVRRRKITPEDLVKATDEYERCIRRMEKLRKKSIIGKK